MNLLVRINDMLEWFSKQLAGLILILFTLTISAMVILRAGFSYPLSWAQDAAVMLFIWMVFLGAPVALRRRIHFIIDMFNGKGGRLAVFFDVVSDVLIFVFLYVMINYGAFFVQITMDMYYSYVYLPQAVVTISIPISGAVMTLMNLENFIKDVRLLCGKGGAQ